QLFRNIDEAREAAFHSEASSHGKELLLTVIFRIAFDLTQGSAPRFAGSASCVGDFGHVSGHIFTDQQFQSFLADDSFVVPSGNEQIEARRAPYLDFCICQRSRYGNRVSKQKPSVRLQQSGPVRNDLQPIWEMVDGVDTNDGVEAGVGEWQNPGSVRDLKLHTWGEPTLCYQRICRCYCLLMSIDANNRTTGYAGHAQGGASCSTSNVKQGLPSRKIEPSQKPILLV